VSDGPRAWADQPDHPPAHQPVRAPQLQVPHAERYVLEADAMRRRQLRSALLHGSGRTWREHPRTWPAVAAGLVVVALVVAAIAVVGVVRAQQEGRDDDASGVPATGPGTVCRDCPTLSGA
jgi:hypothetical protein